MKDIKTIIEETEISSVMEGKLEYKDELPTESDDIKNNITRIKMCYLKGTIIKNEHDENKSKFSEELFTRIINIYDNYIFSDEDIFSIEWSGLDKNEVEEIINLKLLLSDKSKYEEKFNKLIFRMYCESKKEDKELEELAKLKGLAIKIYQTYDWAKDYVNQDVSLKKLFLFSLKESQNDDEYKKLYGIDEIAEHKNNTDQDNKDINNSDTDDWISKKYGGRNFGKETSLDY